MNKIFKWIKEHVRPHFKYYADRGEKIDVKNNDIEDIIEKTKDKVEVGIKFKFKF